MKLLVIILSLLFAILAPCVTFADETNAEMNAVIRAIHSDFLKLNGKYDVFSNYTDGCLWKWDQGLRISYLLPYKTPAANTNRDQLGAGWTINVEPQQPDQILIGYININQTNGFKYWNEFENVGACRFPSLKLKMYGYAIIRDFSNAKLKEMVKQIVESECAKEQEAIKAAAKQN
jgi:hypothetical protein